MIHARHHASTVNAAMVGWLLLAAALVAVGFAVESFTDPLHHVLLIAGGWAAGFGMARSAGGRR